MGSIVTTSTTGTNGNKKMNISIVRGDKSCVCLDSNGIYSVRYLVMTASGYAENVMVADSKEDALSFFHKIEKKPIRTNGYEIHTAAS